MSSSRRRQREVSVGGFNAEHAFLLGASQKIMSGRKMEGAGAHAGRHHLSPPPPLSPSMPARQWQARVSPACCGSVKVRAPAGPARAADWLRGAAKWGAACECGLKRSKSASACTTTSTLLAPRATLLTGKAVGGGRGDVCAHPIHRYKYHLDVQYFSPSLSHRNPLSLPSTTACNSAAPPRHPPVNVHARRRRRRRPPRVPALPDHAFQRRSQWNTRRGRRRT